MEDSACSLLLITCKFSGDVTLKSRGHWKKIATKLSTQKCSVTGKRGTKVAHVRTSVKGGLSCRRSKFLFLPEVVVSQV